MMATKKTHSHTNKTTTKNIFIPSINSLAFCTTWHNGQMSERARTLTRMSVRSLVSFVRWFVHSFIIHNLLRSHMLASHYFRITCKCPVINYKTFGIANRRKRFKTKSVCVCIYPYTSRSIWAMGWEFLGKATSHIFIY